RHGRTVLDDVLLRLRAGESLGVSGPSGGGKTTLIRLLTRDLDPDAGRVTLNGADLRDLDLAALRARISLHEQDAPLLDGTLRENLRLGDHHATDHRLRGLLDDLGLTHLDLDTWVGEGGTRLSGGERARVSLARALLGPGDLLLLDEPTAHLDAATEARVLRVIGRERAGRALLIVTHRAAPLALTGRHLTLRGGHLHGAASVPERTAV
ncbi:MAG: ABC transporter ATP-binding protein, partial [Deinococcota bacterium]